MRRALNQAVDVGTLLGNIMAGRGIRAAGAIPPGIAGYDSARAPYAFDPAKARQLLAEAGYRQGVLDSSCGGRICRSTPGSRRRSSRAWDRSG